MQTRTVRRSNSYFRLLKVLERDNVTGWQFWIDRGGTFTDVIGLAPSGELHTRKVLSVQPGAADGGDPGIRAAQEILEGAGRGTQEGRGASAGVVDQGNRIGATDEVAATGSALAEGRVGVRGNVVGASRIDAVKVGTTVATNALLERKGEPVLLVTTVGFADGLRIGYQSRPDLFARNIVLPDRLYPQVIEANERVDSEGVVLTPLDTERLRNDR